MGCAVAPSRNRRAGGSRAERDERCELRIASDIAERLAEAALEIVGEMRPSALAGCDTLRSTEVNHGSATTPSMIKAGGATKRPSQVKETTRSR